MAHYAFLDEDNIVTQVIVGRNENEVVQGISDWETHYGNFRGQRCVRTSYNNNIRKQFAQPGFHYDSIRDEFVSLKPYDSWTLDANNDWKAPVDKPSIENGEYRWDEATLSWILFYNL